MTGFLKRVVTALSLVAVFLGTLWFEQLKLGFVALITALATVGIIEYFGLLKKHGFASTPALPVILGALIVLTGFHASIVEVNAATAGAAVIVVFTLIVGSKATINTLLGGVIGLVYISWAAAHVSLMFSELNSGPGLVTAMAVAVALTDVGAYFVGKSIGAHKLAPVVSPNKTWEGAIGGFVVAGIGMGVLWQLAKWLEWHRYPDWTLLEYVVVGAALSVASQIGDLAQSALKRDAGVKDSGNIFPGHGGVLDRCDGFLFAAPVLYYLAVLMDQHL